MYGLDASALQQPITPPPQGGVVTPAIPPASEIRLKGNPDERTLRDMFQSSDPVSLMDFAKASSPLFKDYTPASTFTHALNNLGIVTDDVAKARQRAVELESAIIPAFKIFTEHRIAQAKAATQEEAQAQFPNVQLSPHPSSQVELPGPVQPGMPQPTVPNLQAPLRPFQRDVVGADVAQMGHQRVQVPGDVQLVQYSMKLQAAMRDPRNTPEQQKEYAQQLKELQIGQTGGYSKQANPESPEGRIKLAEANIAVPKLAADLYATLGKGTHDYASSNKISQELLPHIDEMLAHTRLLITQGRTAVQRGDLAQDVERLNDVKAKLSGLIAFGKTNMSPEVYNTLVSSIIDGLGGLKAVPPPVTGLRKAAEHILPESMKGIIPGRSKGDVGIERVAPVAPSTQSRETSTPSTVPSAPNVAPNVAADELLKLQKAMKEGEIKVIGGMEYTIRNGQLLSRPRK